MPVDLNNIRLGDVQLNDVMLNNVNLGAFEKVKSGKWKEPSFLESTQFFIPFIDYTNEDVKVTNIVKDICGKGNDFKCFNLGYSLKSGFGGFEQDYNLAYKGSGTLEQTTSKLKLINRSVGWSWVTNLTTDNYNNTTPYKVNVHFEGGSGGKLLLQVTGYTTELFEGENIIYPNAAFDGQTIQFSLYTTDTANPSIVTIEQVPIQKGVWLDGIDDYLQSINALTGIKTLIIKFKPFAKPTDTVSSCIYDNRVDAGVNKSFALSFTPSGNDVAYYERNRSAIGGSTRINNVVNIEDRNTSIRTNQLLGKTHVATLQNNIAPTEDLRNTYIGCTYAKTLFSKCIIECIAGYSEQLNQEELLQEYQRVEFYSLPHRDKVQYYYNFADKTNQDTDFDTVYDLSGKGSNSKLYNFAKTGLSGAKGYYENFNSWVWDSRYLNLVRTDHSASLSTIEGETTIYWHNFRKENTTGDGIELLVKADSDCNFEVMLTRIDGTPASDVYNYPIKANTPTKLSYGKWDTSIYSKIRFVFNKPSGNNIPLTIEQLPLYDGAILFDGIDDKMDNLALDTKVGTFMVNCHKITDVAYLEFMPLGGINEDGSKISSYRNGMISGSNYIRVCGDSNYSELRADGNTNYIISERWNPITGNINEVKIAIDYQHKHPTTRMSYDTNGGQYKKSIIRQILYIKAKLTDKELEQWSDFLRSENNKISYNE